MYRPDLQGYPYEFCFKFLSYFNDFPYKIGVDRHVDFTENLPYISHVISNKFG